MFSWILKLLPGPNTQLLRYLDTLATFTSQQVQQHQGNLDTSGPARDLVDAFLLKMAQVGKVEGGCRAPSGMVVVSSLVPLGPSIPGQLSGVSFSVCMCGHMSSLCVLLPFIAPSLSMYCSYLLSQAHSESPGGLASHSPLRLFFLSSFLTPVIGPCAQDPATSKSHGHLPRPLPIFPSALDVNYN